MRGIVEKSHITDAIMDKATGADFLEKRIKGNAVGQEINFNEWIFKGLKIRKGMKVLELCCGTGAQTMPLIQAVGEKGKIIGIDISQKALDILSAKIGQKRKKNALLLNSSIDTLSKALLDSGIRPNSIDMVFCSYGLYYSKKAPKTLEQARCFLAPFGEIVIVGPFAENNRQLFSLLKSAGVRVSPYVVYTSRDFMHDTVIPWGIHNFGSVYLDKVINKVRWTSADAVLGYWKNTTFYSPEKLRDVTRAVNAHFDSNREFINEKWIMRARIFNEK